MPFPLIRNKGIDMNNEVIFAAAGNGKTYSIRKKAKEAIQISNKYVLLISYTNEGIKSLEREYRKQNNGILDDRITILSWYSFLLSELIHPYQSLVKFRTNNIEEYLPENFVKSIAFYERDSYRRPHYKYTDKRYFFNHNNDIRKDYVSNLANQCNEHSQGKSIRRLEKIYSHIFIDEIQDYAGYDLEIIKLLFYSSINILCVGDHKQSTFRTNNSQKNKQYRNEDIYTYFTNLSKKSLLRITFSNTTRRFNQEICYFVNTIHNDPNTAVIPSHDYPQILNSDHTGVYLIEEKHLSLYCKYYEPVILTYNKTSKINFDYGNCKILTYGSSKGTTHKRSLIIPVSTVLPFLERQVNDLEKNTRAKFYVACTRAMHSIVFAVKKLKINNVFKPETIDIQGNLIQVLKFKRNET